MATSDLEAARQEAEEKEKEREKHIDLLQAVLLPDPLPKAIELSLVADTSSCEPP